MKKLIQKFTTILFTKLNYSKIFASELTISPYKTKNQIQFCINLAHIHLYLSDNYYTIDYKKFADNFNFIKESISDVEDNDELIYEVMQKLV